MFSFNCQLLSLAIRGN